jgi:hypothetical protein
MFQILHDLTVVANFRDELLIGGCDVFLRRCGIAAKQPDANKYGEGAKSS